jgi:hypothetical protein
MVRGLGEHKIGRGEENGVRPARAENSRGDENVAEPGRAKN